MRSTGQCSGLSSRVCLLAAALLIGLAGILTLPETAKATAYSYQYIETDLTVLDNGTFRVVEKQWFQFHGTSVAEGSRQIPLDRTEGVDHIAVYEVINGEWINYANDERERVRTFSVTMTSTLAVVNWRFTPRSNGTLLFVLTYDLIGALGVYPDASPPYQQVTYTPIATSVTSLTPVESAIFIIRLPMRARLEQVEIRESGASQTALARHTRDYQVFSFTRRNLTSGDEWTVTLETNIVALNAGISGWQTALEEQHSREQVIAGLAGLASIVIFMFGFLGIYLFWFRRGRDPHTASIAPFRAEPPSDAPPAVVGVLIDERADDRDIASTFTDWARRGIVSIRHTGRTPMMALLRVPETLTPFERLLLDVVFSDRGYGQGAVTLERARVNIKAHRPELERALFDEVTSRGWFRDSPEVTRERWRSRSTKLALASVPAAFFATVLVSPWLLLPIFTIIGLSFGLRVLSSALPQRTPSGVEEVARWRAFEHYLRDLQRYDSIQTAQARLGEYLPYSIIFGLEAHLIYLAKLAERAQPAVLQGGDQYSLDWLRNVRLDQLFDLPDLTDLPGLPDFSFLTSLNASDLQTVSDAAVQGLEGAADLAGDLLEFVGNILAAVIGALSD